MVAEPSPPFLLRTRLVLYRSARANSNGHAPPARHTPTSDVMTVRREGPLDRTTATKARIPPTKARPTTAQAPSTVTPLPSGPTATARRRAPELRHPNTSDAAATIRTPTCPAYASHGGRPIEDKRVPAARPHSTDDFDDHIHHRFARRTVTSARVTRRVAYGAKGNARVDARRYRLEDTQSSEWASELPPACAQGITAIWPSAGEEKHVGNACHRR